MPDTAADRQWMLGYEAARTLCLTRGIEVARRNVPASLNNAYEAGFDWALWDYEDANGLPHNRERGA